MANEENVKTTASKDSLNFGENHGSGPTISNNIDIIHLHYDPRANIFIANNCLPDDDFGDYNCRM